MEITLRIPIRAPWRRKDPPEYPKYLQDLMAQANCLAIDNQQRFGDAYYQLRMEHAALQDELIAAENRLVETKAKMQNCVRRLAWYEAVMYRPRIEADQRHKDIAILMRAFVKQASAAACKHMMKQSDREPNVAVQPIPQRPIEYA